jgi:hypothetical protein
VTKTLLSSHNIIVLCAFLSSQKLGVTQNLEKNKVECMVTIYLGKAIEYMAQGILTKWQLLTHPSWSSAISLEPGRASTALAT